MKEHPILFSGPMVKAILEGRKTVTRRLSKKWLKVKAGDGLWVRETWAPFDRVAVADQDKNMIFYRADDERKLETDGVWKPSIHMPRWASRITLETTEDARVERLQDITESEAVAEGCVPCEFWTEHGICPSDCGAAVNDFRNLWDSLHAKDAPWSSNPEVVRVAFRRVA